MTCLGWRLITSMTGARSIALFGDDPPEHRRFEDAEPDVEPDRRP